MSETSANGGRRAMGPRLIAIVGPFQSGKTTLLESILARTRRAVATGRGARRFNASAIPAPRRAPMP